MKKQIAAETTAPVAATTTPVIKVTPVEERKYELSNATAALVFKGKQRQIVYNILLAEQKPMTIAELAPIAEEKGLKAIGGVEPSVRYHLHHLNKDGLVAITNPTITIE